MVIKETVAGEEVRQELYIEFAQRQKFLPFFPTTLANVELQVGVFDTLMSEYPRASKS